MDFSLTTDFGAIILHLDPDLVALCIMFLGVVLLYYKLMDGE